MIMSEMDRLAAFRTGLPGPSPETTSRARRRLLQHAFDSRVAAPRRRARRPVVGSLVAAVAVGAAVTAGIVGWNGSTPAAAREASVLLLAASRTAATAPATTIAPGQYVYVRRVGTGAYFTGTITYLQRHEQESWFHPDGAHSARTVMTYGPIAYIREDDAQRLAASGARPPTPGSQQSWTIPPDQAPGGDLGFPSYAFLRSLPTDPNRLSSMISEYSQSRGVTPSQAMLDTVAALLSWSVAPPRLRAALYEVATRIPGIESLGAAVDASGRRGTALAVTAGGTRYEIIFDPITSELLGTRHVVMDDPVYGLPPGTVLSDEAITVFTVAAVGSTAPAARPNTEGVATPPPR